MNKQALLRAVTLGMKKADVPSALRVMRSQFNKESALALPSPKGSVPLGEKLRALLIGGMERAKPVVKQYGPAAAGGAAVGALGTGLAMGGKKKEPEKEKEESEKKDEKSASFARFTKRAAEMPNDISALGLLVGYEQGITPPAAAFEKVAAATGYSAAGLKQLYMEKVSAAWPWVLGGLGAAAVGGPLLSNMYHRAMYPSYYEGAPGWGLMDAPNLGTYGGLSPAAEQEAWKTIAREGLKQRQMSSLLQGISGAYRPSGTPWGYSHPGVMPQ